MDPHSQRHVLGTPTRKIRKAAPGEYEWLLQIADRASPKVRQAFLKAIERIRGEVDEAALRAAFETGSVARVLDALGIDQKLQQQLGAQLTPQIEDTFIAAGRAAVANTLPGAALTMRFDISNPKASEFLQAYDFGLIRQISQETRQTIQGIVLNAFRYGGHPYTQARIIRDAIGLTDAQGAAVANFRRMLEDGDRGALTRDLRDRRYDPTLDQALGAAPTKTLPPAQIETMVDRYRSRMLDSRAENIARTETLRAANAAQGMAWDQAADEGLLNRVRTRQQWLVTPDDRLCPLCAAVPDMNQEGVPLGGEFQTPLGPTTLPPLHPQCRCTVVLSEL